VPRIADAAAGPGGRGYKTRLQEATAALTEKGLKIGNQTETNDLAAAGTVIAQDKSKKIVDVTFRRRKASMRTKGHRQPYTALKISGITG